MKKALQNVSTYPLIVLTLIAFSCVFLTYRFRSAGIVLGIGTFLFFLFFLIKKRRLCRCSVFALLLLLCIIRVCFSFYITDQKLLQYTEQEFSATIRIDKVEKNNNYYQEYQVSFLECNGQPVSAGKGILSSSQATPYALGTVLKGEFHASLPEEYAYGFANRIYQYSSRILICLEPSAEELQVIAQEDSFSVFRIADRLRDRLSMRLLRWDKQSAALAQALLFGNKSALSPNIRTDFTLIGAAHILAISGMHLSIFTALLFYFFRKIALPKIVRIPLLVLAIFFCACLTNFTPSVLRAALLSAVGLLFSFSYRRISPLSLLALVGLIFVLLDPHMIFHVGFLLSYFATLGILVAHTDPIKKASPEKKISVFGKRISTILWDSLTAILFTIPLSAIFFREISFFGILSSLLLIPLCTLSIYASLCFLVLPDFLVIGSVFPNLLSLPLKLMLWFAEKLARFPFPTLVPNSALLWIFLLPFLTILLFYILKHPQKKKLYALLLLGICLFQWQTQIILNFAKRDALQLRLYHEEASEILFVSDGDTNLLIDLQGGSYPLLRAALSDCTVFNQITTPDALILTDYRDELPKLLSSVLAYERIPSLYLPNPKTQSEQAISALIEDLALYYQLFLHYYETSFYVNDIHLHSYPESDFLLQKGSLSIAHFPATWNQTQAVAMRFRTLRDDPSAFYFFFAPGAILPTQASVYGQYISVNEDLSNVWYTEIPL